MTDYEISQSEADYLLRLRKHKVDTQVWEYPATGGKISIPLSSDDPHESFLLDISRGRIDLLKGKYQTRGRTAIVLARIDFNGAPHRNPDGMEVACPHLHVYREGFGDKWAYALAPENFSNPNDLWLLLNEFMQFCNIVEPPQLMQGLFQ